ncbi:MAG: glycosyltransferase family 9 protein [Gammaproteobacteria bacterium]|nr:glycosyltransferase family 9 protein [Gammaproteobacteria bacterium]
MLAWPLFALLKHHWPEGHVSALVPLYTAPMAELCPWIDEVVIDQRKPSALADLSALRSKMLIGHFDALLTLFSTGRVALAGYLAGIPYRLTPATKLAQFCYNRRLPQRRSRSEKPEYAYNLDLGYRFLQDLKGLEPHLTQGTEDFLPVCIKRPLLRFDSDEIERLRGDFCANRQLSAKSRLVFIHPGSGGSANNLLLAQYAVLANTLQGTRPLAFVITAGPGEEEVAAEVCKGITAHPATVLQPHNGLGELARDLAFADLFISNSTGPLHMAAALDRPTAAFYPRHRSATPLRWQTLNAPDKRLVFVPPPEVPEDAVSGIDVVAAARRISATFLR